MHGNQSLLSVKKENIKLSPVNFSHSAVNVKMPVIKCNVPLFFSPASQEGCDSQSRKVHSHFSAVIICDWSDTFISSAGPLINLLQVLTHKHDKPIINNRQVTLTKGTH